MSKCMTVVLIKTEMDVSGFSWKGRDSLSSELVEYEYLKNLWIEAGASIRSFTGVCPIRKRLLLSL